MEIRVFNKTKIDFKLNAAPLSNELLAKENYNKVVCQFCIIFKIEFVGATEISLASTLAIEDKKQPQDLKGIFAIKVQLEKEKPETIFGFNIVSNLENLSLVLSIPIIVDLGVIKRE